MFNTLNLNLMLFLQAIFLTPDNAFLINAGLNVVDVRLHMDRGSIIVVLSGNAYLLKVDACGCAKAGGTSSACRRRRAKRRWECPTNC